MVFSFTQEGGELSSQHDLSLTGRRESSLPSMIPLSSGRRESSLPSSIPHPREKGELYAQRG